jgi:predicted nucleic acid-binding protein
MLYYFDSSVVVKRYAKEMGTAWVKQFFTATVVSKIYIAQITSLEVAAGLSRKVRTKELSQKNCLLALNLFLADLEQDDHSIILVSDEIIKLAIDLTRQYPLRAYDALHLATTKTLNDALEKAKLPTVIFVSADTLLLTAAESEGLVVDNPNLHEPSGTT